MLVGESPRTVVENRNLPSVNKTTTRSPVQLELAALRTRNGLASEGKSLVCSLGSRKLDEAVASIAV